MWSPAAMRPSTAPQNSASGTEPPPPPMSTVRSTQPTRSRWRAAASDRAAALTRRSPQASEAHSAAARAAAWRV